MSDLQAYRKLFDLEGKVALIAGGAGGIGRAISEGFAAYGAQVVICGRNAKKADALASSIAEAGGKSWAAGLDITDASQVKGVVEEVVERSGGIDILTNCVGRHIEASALEYKGEDWDAIVGLNLKAAFFLSQAVARVQVEKGGGKHIHITSVRSLLGLKRGYISHCSSKGGMNLMVKQLATEWAKHNITVNGIAPTFTRTELVAKYLNDPKFYDPLVERIPLGRVGEPIDIAGMALYLASPAADFITGQIIFADGGLTACQ